MKLIEEVLLIIKEQNVPRTQSYVSASYYNLILGNRIENQKIIALVHIRPCIEMAAL